MQRLHSQGIKKFQLYLIADEDLVSILAWAFLALKAYSLISRKTMLYWVEHDKSFIT